MVMSALPPKADMCSANTDVGYGPKADIDHAVITKKARDNCRARRRVAAILSMLRRLSQQVEHGHCSERARVALPTFHVSHD
jgi:hypothetical protein